MWKWEKHSNLEKAGNRRKFFKIKYLEWDVTNFLFTPVHFEFEVLDLLHWPHFYRFNPVCSTWKSFPRLKRKRDGHEKPGRPEEEREPTDGEPTPAKRDDIENFSGNWRKGWLGCKGTTGGKCRKVERLASTSAIPCASQKYTIDQRR